MKAVFVTPVLRLGLGLLAMVAMPVRSQTSAPITVAVLDFQNHTGRFALDVWQSSVPELLKTELSRSPRLVVLERQKLEAILHEQALGQAGVLDESTTQRVGQLAGAQFMLTGEISLAGTGLRIDCHLLKVETGQVRGEKITGPGEKAMEAMVRVLAANLIHNLTGEGQHTAKARLRSYPARWLGLAALGAAAATTTTHLLSEQAYQDYQDATRLTELEHHYDRASRLRHWRDGLAITTGVLALGGVYLWRKGASTQNQILAAGEHAPLPSVATLSLVAAQSEWRMVLRLTF